MLDIHTIAAGGGSILFFDGSRYQVGPASAGANPGPACYQRGGALTITDANVLLGKIQPAYFPAIFGPEGNQPLDSQIVQHKFADWAQATHSQPEQVAAGFISIAVINMANAIKKISLQRGYDVTAYVLCCFGGAGGQLACLLADTLGMKTIFLHPYAGVLSAYGMGLADIRSIREVTVERPLNSETIAALVALFRSLVEPETQHQQQIQKVYLKYQGTDTALPIDFVQDIAKMQQDFERTYRSRYGFIQANQTIMVASISLELVEVMAVPPEPIMTRRRPLGQPPQAVATVPVFTNDRWHDTPVYQRADLEPGDTMPGPAIIGEAIGTIVVEPNWTARLTDRNHLILERQQLG
jgi:5-oxoprolinase (ATP-hydrolysing)